MNEGVKELKILTVSKCTEDGAAYMAILREKDGKRILPVLMERSEALQLLMKMKDGRRPVLPSSMADVMRAAFLQCGMDVEEVRIANVEAGVTYCHLLYRDENVFHMVRYCKAADCLILAYTFDCPITISEKQLFNRNIPVILRLRLSGDSATSTVAALPSPRSENVRPIPTTAIIP